MSSTPADVDPLGIFAAGGEVGADLAQVDWAATPLGPPATWPTSLWTAVRIVLTSRFSMWMAWGEQLTFFCNAAYRRDTLGAKYPWALGRPTSEVWAEIWADVHPRIDQVIATGEATWDDALLLFLERSGYPEETYHTFSYSPLAADDGAVSGMLCVVSEETERVISRRRMGILQDLGASLVGTRDEAELFATLSSCLGAHDDSLPFTATYLFDDAPDDAVTAHLVATSGIAPGHVATPTLLGPDGAGAPWSVAAALRGEVAVVERLDELVPDLPTGRWWLPPTHALVVPLVQQGEGRPSGFFAAALNRHRPLDAGYRGFLQLLADQVAAAVGRARAYEAERLRAEDLAALDRAKTQFFTNISHEFRTPLTLLLGPAEDALADEGEPLPPGQRERLPLVRRNGQRLLGLVNTLLDFSRLESGQADPTFAATDLAATTAELAASFAPAYERASLSLDVDCPPLPQPVHVDPEMWAKVVLNLLSNALKFTFEGGVAVSLRAEGGEAVLRVADTGVGIAPADQERLFERFQRVASTRSRSYEGSGIGLALVAELAAVHGGTVGLESEPGRGSTFAVRVPFGTGHLPPAEVRDEALPSSVATGPVPGFLAEADRWLSGHALPTAAPATAPDPRPGGGPRPRVLVVDDNGDMRRYIAGLLELECDVELAADGQDGLEAARRRPPDLVLTDVMMPRLDGFGLLAALRANPATFAVPVVMLSARAGEDGVVEGLDAGADDYLIKPFSGRELQARVRANLELDRARRVREQLERSRGLLDQAQRMAKVGSFELDLATRALDVSPEFARQLELEPAELATEAAFEAVMGRLHPDDRERALAGLAAAEAGEPMDHEVRVILPGAGTRLFRSLGELLHDEGGRPVRLRGTNQDITEQRAAEQALAAATAEREVALREQQIADSLQRSLLPGLTFQPDELDVATWYRAGVEGTQVGGDWYDVIELGAGRTGLVVGDVMGRGVQAAAVMGQLRSAARAYARLDFPPADVLELLDAVVRDLGDEQMATCAYAVYDPADRTLTYASAGHLPLILAPPDAEPLLLRSAGQPLGTGPVAVQEQTVALPAGSLVVLYTDGLVERRDLPLDEGIGALARAVAEVRAPLGAIPSALVDALGSGATDDDVAVLVARASDVDVAETSSEHVLPSEDASVAAARRHARQALRQWEVAQHVVDDVELIVSELVTNAIRYGSPPVRMRLRRSAHHVLLEVHDTATVLPQRMRPTADDEHGRGIQLTALLADRWGTRPTRDGKSVWCAFRA